VETGEPTCLTLAERSRGLGPAPHRGTPQWTMAVNSDCRHYIMQTTARGDKVERCRVEANQALPFACPDGCVFYEPRKVSSAGWHVPPPKTEEPPPR